jgi:hypothetical protein
VTPAADLQGLERRTVLRLFGVVAAAGALPAGCTGLPDAFTPGQGAALRTLSARSYAVLTAAAQRIVGPAGAPLIASRTVDVGRLADAWLARTPVLAAPVAQALTLLEFGTWPLLGKVRPFTALDDAGRDRVLAECMTSRLEVKRSVFRGVRSLVLLAFYGHPASRAAIGYPGPFGSATVTIADAMRDL